ncbi:MAG: molybdenum cofactor guanylyltransferase [Gammaproteobacteria bacterium]|nr:molybdenum cofactor guanylyltransferase [Gammaproteobacteria bacterium]
MNGVVLAGGASLRMGMDKALLPYATGDPRTLAERQVALLRRSGADRVFVSLRRDGPVPSSALVPSYRGDAPEVVYDERPGMGPLGGIVAAMTRDPHLHLIVLAVDMAGVGADIIGALVAASTAEAGAAPSVSGRLEALCAVYPPHAAATAETEIRGPRRSPSALLARLAGEGRVRSVRFPAQETDRFRSWNRPRDLPPELLGRIAQRPPEGRNATPGTGSRSSIA